ncbi:hypothetical protein EVJ58_g5043 [Rhodofomes roseus]|uniref:Uncharacterized protein n=1 Tax=Rhodofomes roseus TaxID=34475 RepID=A0A4Y9YDL4_9APHY|nr:hypothetical protein EVJ58_g5043 [Rhodofomes roseus]
MPMAATIPARAAKAVATPARLLSDAQGLAAATSKQHDTPSNTDASWRTEPTRTVAAAAASSAADTRSTRSTGAASASRANRAEATAGAAWPERSSANCVRSCAGPARWTAASSAATSAICWAPAAGRATAGVAPGMGARGGSGDFEAEIGTPILPRFFQVTTQSGVQSMSLSLDGARERATNNVRAVVECPDALWTFRYLNGYTVVLKGPFTANVVAVTEPQMQNYTLRIESLIFDALTHEKLINIDSIEGTRIASSPAASQGMGDVDPRYEEPRTVIERASFPAEPINAFGIPQATMRCLELAESVTQMGDLIQFSASQQMGPKEALSRYAERLRENYRQATAGEFKPDLGPKSNLPGRPGPGTNALDGVNGGVPPTPPSSMYPGTPSSSSMQQGQAPPTPQNPPHAEPGKQGKGSQQQASSQNMVSTPASASTPAAAQTPGGPTTPAMASAPLKRKAGQRAEPESPALANSATDPQPPPAKRPTRKRPRTGTQGGG